MRVDFVTLFPDMVLGALSHSIMARAADAGHAEFQVVDPRDFCYDRNGKVDDSPYGGEPGMLIRAEPVALAIESLKLGPEAAVVLTSPTGATFTQNTARHLASFERIALLCGHYEGFDHRLEQRFVTHTVSIGDYVLTSGELAALVISDAVVRLLPGVLGSPDSLCADSHADGLLSAPNYTRPEIWRGHGVPQVLLSGNHAAIAKWRREESLKTTRSNRPDLLAKAKLMKADLDSLLGL